jgi:hypothetical protein
MDDGAGLLTSADVGDLLETAVQHAGGRLTGWRLDHVDASPGRSTTATYAATVAWPGGVRAELLGASTRVGGRRGNDERAVIFGDGDREVAVWLYPSDPDLPGLPRAAVPEELAALLTEHDVFGGPVRADQLAVEVVSYRPRRRAVLRVRVSRPAGPGTCYVKVLREAVFGPALERHTLLSRGGLPTPVVAAATRDCLLVLREVPGRPLAQALFDEAFPCRAEELVAVLDALPAAAATLPRRPAWADAVADYAAMVAASLPALSPRLDRLTAAVATTAGAPPGVEATHGDFHEGQLFVRGGRLTGLIDVDTVGPGRRVDDLACLLAHLSTVQRMDAAQAAGLERLVRLWLPVFDARVDPAALRLRAAGVVISLATGPYRGQEPDWEASTVAMVATAERLVRSASR